MKRKITEQLVNWKNSPSRKPLILNGARQVGKTFILREFGRENYKNVVYINLESNETAASMFEGDIIPNRLIKCLEQRLEKEFSQTKLLSYLMRFNPVSELLHH